MVDESPTAQLPYTPYALRAPRRAVLGRPKILLAQDEGERRRTLVRRLEAEGYDVRTLDDPASAGDVAEPGWADLVVFDVGVASRGRLAALERYANLASRGGQPVILRKPADHDDHVISTIERALVGEPTTAPMLCAAG